MKLASKDYGFHVKTDFLNRRIFPPYERQRKIACRNEMVKRQAIFTKVFRLIIPREKSLAKYFRAQHNMPLDCSFWRTIK